MGKIILSLGVVVSLLVSCDKKESNNCPDETTTSYDIPETYDFKNASGLSTVSYEGQTDRLNQLREMVTYMKTANSQVVNAQQLKDMFANTNDDGNGHFTFTSSKQLKSKCFSLDVSFFEDYMDSLELASNDFQSSASSGQAGVLTSGTSSYLFTKTGKEPLQFIEKGLMGAVFMYQALNVYFGDDKMSADNTSIVDAQNGKYYTALEHYWDEAFGYFGVGIDFPSTIPGDFWGKYSNAQDGLLGCNEIMMDNFIKGRAAISAKIAGDKEEPIQLIQNTWEDISANQAIKYLDDANTAFGNDNARLLHVLSEAYAFTMNLKYCPEETRNMTQTEIQVILDMFGDNFWDLSKTNILAIKSALELKY